MPAKIYGAYRKGGYLTQAEADRASEMAAREDELYREQKLEKRLGQMSKLAQAYQDYSGRKGDREIYRGLLNGGQQTAGPAVDPRITAPTGPGGADPQFLSQADLARQNVMPGRSMPGQLPQGAAQSRPGLFQRMKQSFQAGRPLSSIETALAEAVINRRFPSREDATQADLQKAQAGWYNRRRSGSTTKRAPRGFDEIQAAIEASEPGMFDSKEKQAYKRRLREAALAELARYQNAGGGGGGDDVQLSMLIQEYKTTDEPNRAAELEEILLSQGVEIS